MQWKPAHRPRRRLIDPLETTVGGTYRDGKIVLDRPMKWAEGTRVVVQLYNEEGGLIEGVWPADGSAEGNAEILRRTEEPDPDPLTPEEAEEFARAVEEARRFLRSNPSREAETPP